MIPQVTTRIPIVATLVVVLAVAIMIGLGFWQLDRLKQKEAALAAFTANITRPLAPLPEGATDAWLFRNVSATCARVTGWQITGGRTRDDRPGWRHIATCAGPAGLRVDMGVGADPNASVSWAGGTLQGRLVHEPDSHSFITRLAGMAPPLHMMVISTAAAPGLAPSPPPDPSSVPNNHLSYAVQWFIFAGVALIIYGLALRKRWRER